MPTCLASMPKSIRMPASARRGVVVRNLAPQLPAADDGSATTSYVSRSRPGRQRRCKWHKGDTVEDSPRRLRRRGTSRISMAIAARACLALRVTRRFDFGDAPGLRLGAGADGISSAERLISRRRRHQTAGLSSADSSPIPRATLRRYLMFADMRDGLMAKFLPERPAHLRCCGASPYI